MSAERLFTWRNPWFAAGIGVTAAIVVLSLIVGFVLLPYANALNTEAAEQLLEVVCT